MKRYILFFVVLVFLLPFKSAGQDYVFTQLTTKDGLASLNPNFIAQDSNGYMWIGRQNVLQRYDGHRFKNFYIGKDKAIPGNNLLGIQPDGKNRLWLLTGQNNLGYLDLNKLTYHSVKVITPPGYENLTVALQVNKSNSVILIYVGKGISTYSEENNEVSIKYNQFNLPKGYEPRHIWQDKLGNYWMGTKNGLVKYNSKKKLLSYGGHNVENDPVIAAFGNRKETCVIYTFKNRSWIMFDNVRIELFSLEHSTGKTKDWTDILYKTLEGKYFALYGVIEVKDGSTWLIGGGIFAQLFYEENQISLLGKEITGPKNIWYNEVNNLLQDREGNIWVCTDRGVYRFNPSYHLFKTISLKAHNENKIYNTGVTDIMESKDGEVLVSTWGGGVFTFDKDMMPKPPMNIVRKSHNAGGMVWNLAQLKNGDIWLGYQFGMIGIYSSQLKKMTWTFPKQFNGSTVRQLVVDNNDNVWFGTQGGHIIKWDKISQEFRMVFKSNRIITKLLFDTKQNLWIGTDNDGIYCLDINSEKILNHYTDQGIRGRSLLINGASDIIQYNDTTLIIAASGLNILNLKNQTFTYLDEGSQISSLVKDNDNNLWFTTENSVICRKPGKSHIKYVFNEIHGISNFSYETGAAICLKNGKLLFGTNKDIQIIDPKMALNLIPKTPKTYISQIWIGDVELNTDSILQIGTINLNYSQNSLSIKYTNNQYQYLNPIYYKLEGRSDQWRMLPENGELNLNYLSPGNYTITTACLDENEKAGPLTTIEIDLASPFYKQWWFFALFALGITSIIIFMERDRIKRKELLQNMRSNVAAKLHEEVNESLNDINVLSEMAKFNANTNPHKSIEFIEQISTHSKNMISAMDEMLWIIDPTNDKMRTVIEKIDEYIRSQINIHAKSIVFTVEENLDQIDLPMKLRNEIFQLIKTNISILMHENFDRIIFKLSKKQAYLICELTIEGLKNKSSKLNEVFINHEFEKLTESLNALVNFKSFEENAIILYKVPIVLKP